MKKTRSLFIVIPTYNEADNIGDLVVQIEKTAATLPDWKISILVTDDKSPDGTAEIVKKLQAGRDNLYLILGDKKGLGAAYTRAFEYVLLNFDPDYIMQMDADFQHNPKDIPRFLSKTGRGYQFIIGSRYISGGDYPDWSFKRKLYSWGANLIARYIAGIYDIDDCTSGFRCISAKFLRSFDLHDLKSNGYAFQMSLLHAAHKKGLKTIQIPILFPNRKKGTSKLGTSDIREFFINAIRLRFKKYHWLNKERS